MFKIHIIYSLDFFFKFKKNIESDNKYYLINTKFGMHLCQNKENIVYLTM